MIICTEKWQNIGKGQKGGTYVSSTSSHLPIINSVIITTIAAVFQILALIWFLITFLPFGEKIMSFWNTMIFGSRVTNVLPI
uniref:Uncharacterized protein n=1 Tax=Strongyloides venezuelensis TaxID=75913 RepID=A0A0K0FJ19_STRVS